MSGLGSGSGGEWTFLDIVTLVSFIIGVENLELNATQDDMARIQRELSDKTEQLLTELHGHLELQDKKIDQILEVLKVEDHTKTI